MWSRCKMSADSFLLGVFFLLKVTVLRYTYAELTLTQSSQHITENSPLTLKCSYEGNLSVQTYIMSVPSASTTAGSLLADCSVFLKAPDDALYEFNCPTNKTLEWTIKKVTRANEGDTWRCYIGFTTTGSEEARFTIVTVKVSVQNVSMTRPPENSLTVLEKTEIVFLCTTSGGTPAATIRWYKDQGTTVTSDDEEITDKVTATQITDNDLTYVTSTLRYSAEGNANGVKIYCTAKNIIDTVISNRKPYLNVQYSPDSLTIQDYNNGSSYKIIEGSQGSLSCIITGGNPLATLSWNCYNGRSATVVDKSIVTKTVTWNASRDTDRSCTCQSSHLVAGTQSVSVNVQVLYAPNTPTFKVQNTNVPESISFIEGKTHSVVCESKGKPDPDIYVWTKGGTTVRNGKTLTFDSVQKQDDGEYICTAQNTMIPSSGPQQTKSNNSTISLTVLYSPEIRDLTEATVAFGSNFNFSCPVIHGNPASATFKWTREKDSMVWDQQILHIVNISKHDDMIYTCTVNNTMNPTGASLEYGKDSGSFHLNVWYKASVTSFIAEGFEGYTEVTVNENDFLQMKCMVDSNPGSFVEILFQGSTVYQKNNTKSLILNRRKAACLDAGSYSCTASNLLNHNKSSSKEVTVYVKCSPRPLYQIKKNITSPLNVPVTLSFTALAYPVPGLNGFVWQKQNGFTWVPLLSNVDLFVSSSELQTNLTIRNVSLSDYGHYRVTVTNEIGKYDQYMFLTDKVSVSQEETSVNVALIVGVTLGSVCGVFAVIVTIVLIKKKTCSEVLAKLPFKMQKQTTYVNRSFNPDDPDVSEESDKGGTQRGVYANDGEYEEYVQNYTKLSKCSADGDNTMYDVIQQAEK